MRRKLYLGCSLLVHGFTNLLLVEILLSFYNKQQLHVTKNIVFVTKIIQISPVW